MGTQELIEYYRDILGDALDGGGFADHAQKITRSNIESFTNAIANAGPASKAEAFKKGVRNSGIDYSTVHDIVEELPLHSRPPGTLTPSEHRAVGRREDFLSLPDEEQARKIRLSNVRNVAGYLKNQFGLGDNEAEDVSTRLGF